MPSIAVLLAMVACQPSPWDSGAASVDLTASLGESQARAGQLTDQDVGAFMGGTAGEAAADDYLLYNDRARFVVRGPRQGHWYVGEPGSLIDLDIVRPQGQADRDGLNELLTMVGFGRLFVADSFQVLADGQEGGAAVVQAVGHDMAIPYIEGMLESPGLFEPNGVTVTQTFVLQPGVPVLEVITTVRNTTDDDLSLAIMDAGMTDVATLASFSMGAGFDGAAPDGDRPMLAMVSYDNGQAWAVFRADGDMEPGLSSLGEGLDMVLAQGDTLELAPGEVGSSARLIGVAADLATLERYRRQVQGLATGQVEGRVLAGDDGQPVPGARVFLTDEEGVPVMMTISDEDGAYGLPAQPGDYQLVVVGDGDNLWLDLPAGWGPYGIYAHPSAQEVSLLAHGDPQAALPVPQADGYTEELRYVILAVIVLVILYVVRKVVRRRRRGLAVRPADLAIDVASLTNAGPPAESPVLQFYYVPVRLACVVLAPAGRELDGWRMVDRGDGVGVWKNPWWRAELRLAQRVVAAPSEGAGWELLGSEPPLLPDGVLLPAGGAFGVTGAGTLRVLHAAPERIEVEVAGDGPQLLVVARSWLPGWRALVDGRPAAVLRANLAGLGVAVPAGGHRVELVYSPWTVSGLR